jgi:hypothetical protein
LKIIVLFSYSMAVSCHKKKDLDLGVKKSEQFPMSGHSNVSEPWSKPIRVVALIILLSILLHCMMRMLGSSWD